MPPFTVQIRIFKTNSFKTSYTNKIQSRNITEVMPKHTHLILCTLRVIPKVRFRRYQILLVRHRLCRETRLGLRAHCKLQPELMRDWASIDCSLINTVHGSDPIGACSWKKLIQPPWNKRSTPYLMIVRNCDMVISWGTKNLYLSNSGRSTSFEYRLIIIYNPGFFFRILLLGDHLPEFLWGI